jgi:cyclic pyranopterin phosphate synthase
MNLLSDLHGRHFQYLRLSITDACNFKCKYCLPHGYHKTEGAEPLGRNEIFNLVSAFAELGTFKVRLTGGEPTLRRDLKEIIQDLKGVPGIETVALSTNGFKLGAIAGELKMAGLDSINISVDSLREENFAELTGMDRLKEVREGIESALKLSFGSIKINAVLLKKTFHEELKAFSEWVKKTPVTVRFIELMPTGSTLSYFKENHVPANVIRETLVENAWIKRAREIGDGPAEEWMHPEAVGRLGVIAPYGKEFCSTCNRLRVSSRGELRLCLFAEKNHSLRDLLQSAAQKEDLKARLIELVSGKEKTHYLPEGRYGNNFSFSSIGG